MMLMSPGPQTRNGATIEFAARLKRRFEALENAGVRMIGACGNLSGTPERPDVVAYKVASAGSTLLLVLWGKAGIGA